ncbi:hypothetical protein [Streptomyces sp. NPDC002133]|uniref:hypothetical protein n=1 Tax=Streptomyces sp. NPDC002133 TaxID=3154409 RepID=UPI003325242E
MSRWAWVPIYRTATPGAAADEGVPAERHRSVPVVPAWHGAATLVLVLLAALGVGRS